MSEKTKTPREMAEEIEKELKKSYYYREYGATAEELIMLGLEAGAKMGWEAFDDFATRRGRSFDEWWASLEGEK